MGNMELFYECQGLVVEIVARGLTCEEETSSGWRLSDISVIRCYSILPPAPGGYTSPADWLTDCREMWSTGTVLRPSAGKGLFRRGTTRVSGGFRLERRCEGLYKSCSSYGDGSHSCSCSGERFFFMYLCFCPVSVFHTSGGRSR